MHQASMRSSRSSSTSRAGSRARTQLYRSSPRSGIMNLSGSLATSAARSSFGKPNPSRSSSGDTAAYTIRPIRYFVWSRMRCSVVRGNDIAIRRTSSALAMNQTLQAEHSFRVGVEDQVHHGLVVPELIPFPQDAVVRQARMVAAEHDLLPQPAPDVGAQ